MLEDRLKDFDNKNILVIGDVMLDKYIIGDVKRISPEAPVPIVHAKKEYSTPGGAANVANNIASLGGKATLIGIIGDDEAGNKLGSLCRENNIIFDPIISDNTVTIQKIRVMARNHPYVRIDYEDKNINAQDPLITKVSMYISNADIIVISDYAKGTIKKPLMDYIKKMSRAHKKKIIVDPKPENIDLYKYTYLITPNAIESEEMYKEIYGKDIGIEKIGIIGQGLSKYMHSNVLITRGEYGMSLFEKYSKPINILTKARKVYDVSGAGDTVIATIALCVAAGVDLKTSAEIANHAAGIVVGKVGTATTTREELLKKM